MLSLKTATLSQRNPGYAAYHRVRFCEHDAHAHYRPTNSSVLFRRWSSCGKHAASARAWLRETNAERSHVIFPCESAVCSACNNMKEFAIRTVHFCCICSENTAVQGRLPILQTRLAAQFVESCCRRCTLTAAFLFESTRNRVSSHRRVTARDARPSNRL